MGIVTRRDFLRSLAGGTAAALATRLPVALGAENPRRPDVLFLAIEDVSAMRFGCYGDKVCRTPNIDRLAGRAVRFDLAHCTAPPCNPSRTALLTCRRPETTKVFGNRDDWRKMHPGILTMPAHLRKHGYETVRIGKIFHGKFEHDASWSRVVRERAGLPPARRRRALKGPGVELARKQQEALRRWRQAGKKGRPPRSGVPFLYGPSGLTDEEEADGGAATNAIRVLRDKHDKPLFLALGFHKPHLAFTAPDKYFQMYPPEKIELPKNPPNDLDDMPRPPGQRDQKSFTPKMWREAIAAHYACLTFVDAQVGRVLEALAESGRADSTIVVLWSDHGFLLGEHFAWRKGALFDEGLIVALIFHVPGLTRPGVCKRPVDSIDIFPTLFDLCGVPMPKGIQGISMKPLLADPSRPWRKGAISSSGSRGRSIRTERFRYSEYGGADQAELYDHKTDPGEFTNVVKGPKHADTVAELSRLLRADWKATLPDS